MDTEQIIKFMVDNKLTLTDVIEAVIEAECIIGVGLISFAAQLSEQVLAHLDKSA